MIKIENIETYGWEAAIRGMRNPKNSWDKSNSIGRNLGPDDFDLARILVNSGTDHSKFMRMIGISMDITAPLYWWKEFDTYKVGTVANSCSTMHKIADKEFTLEDFSCEHLFGEDCDEDDMFDLVKSDGFEAGCTPIDFMQLTIGVLNHYRQKYLTAKEERSENAKDYWWQMIQLLPSCYNQRRTVMLNYAVARNQYHARKGHKLDEWHTYCDVLATLPYSELITMSKK